MFIMYIMYKYKPTKILQQYRQKKMSIYKEYSYTYHIYTRICHVCAFTQSMHLTFLQYFDRVNIRSPLF